MYEFHGAVCELLQNLTEQQFTFDAAVVFQVGVVDIVLRQ